MTSSMLSLSPADACDDASRAVAHATADGCDCVDSRRLFQGARELIIDHAGNAYHLRITRNDKLILTK